LPIVPRTKRSGAGQEMSPALNPAGAVKAISVGRPESPGLRQ